MRWVLVYLKRILIRFNIIYYQRLKIKLSNICTVNAISIRIIRY